MCATPSFWEINIVPALFCIVNGLPDCWQLHQKCACMVLRVKKYQKKSIKMLLARYYQGLLSMQIMIIFILLVPEIIFESLDLRARNSVG